MKLESINPLVYNIAYFKHIEKQSDCPKLSFEKTQYSYRFIMVDDGCVDVLFLGKTERLYPGDLLYLLPGDRYRLLPCGENFSLFSIFFNFNNDKYNLTPLDACVFVSDFNSSKQLPIINFEDASVFNKSGVFKNIYSKRVKELVYNTNKQDFYLFNTRIAVLTIISDILNSQTIKKSVSISAKNIVNYIKTNPENQLTIEGLSKKFSYHKNHINKLIKEETGKSLIEFIRFVKIEYAKTLLFETDYSLNEISERLGYYDYSHFYKAFVQETNIAPSDYKKKRG